MASKKEVTDICQYIQRQLASGVSIESIKDRLHSVGWSYSDIDFALTQSKEFIELHTRLTDTKQLLSSIQKKKEALASKMIQTRFERRHFFSSLPAVEKEEEIEKIPPKDYIKESERLQKVIDALLSQPSHTQHPVSQQTQQAQQLQELHQLQQSSQSQQFESQQPQPYQKSQSQSLQKSSANSSDLSGLQDISQANSSQNSSQTTAQAVQQVPITLTLVDEDDADPSSAQVKQVATLSSQYKNPKSPNIALKVELLEEKFKNLSINQRLQQADPVTMGLYNPVEADELETVDTPIGDRVQTGIADLDSVIEGGFVRKSSTVVYGGPGAGKTTFGLQYLINGIVLYNEPGVYITFEQTRESIISLGKNYGWDIENLEAQHMLIIHEYSPEQLTKAISGGGGSLRDLIDSIKAKRLVLDSITEYLSLFTTEISSRKACSDIFRLCVRWGVTLIAVGEDTTVNGTHQFTVLDYEADGIILLYNERRGDVRLRFLEILKMRDTRHAGRVFPMKLTKNGIVVKVGGGLVGSQK
jgi:KaiC/GvpD/RAD55 family RecA-like ATPase